MGRYPFDVQLFHLLLHAGSSRRFHKIEEGTGAAKEKFGKATDNEDLEADGRADQTEGKAKQAGEHVKDAGRDVRNTAKNAFGE